MTTPTRNVHFSIKSSEPLVQHRVRHLQSTTFAFLTSDCCFISRYKRNYDNIRDTATSEICKSANCNPYASKPEDLKPHVFGLGADARSTYSLECENMQKHSQMAREASSQSPKTSPVKDSSMAIFSKCSLGQFSTNYSQSYDAPTKESYKASSAVSFHPKPNPMLTDPNRKFGLDGVDSLYKTSFVGGGKEPWFSQLPAFRPVHAEAGSSGPFCGSSTARDSYLNSGNNAELHKKNTEDAKVNKNRGRLAQTNPRPYVRFFKMLCIIIFLCMPAIFIFTDKMQVWRSGIKCLSADFCESFSNQNRPLNLWQLHMM